MCVFTSFVYLICPAFKKIYYFVHFAHVSKHHTDGEGSLGLNTAPPVEGLFALVGGDILLEPVV